MQGYRFKALIAAAKYNVSTEGITGLCKDWVDEYASCTFGDPTDAVSLASTTLLATLMICIRQILSGNRVYDKFGIIQCTLCPQIIELAKTMKRHTDDSTNQNK